MRETKLVVRLTFPRYHEHSVKLGSELSLNSIAVFLDDSKANLTRSLHDSFAEALPRTNHDAASREINRSEPHS